MLLSWLENEGGRGGEGAFYFYPPVMVGRRGNFVPRPIMHARPGLSFFWPARLSLEGGYDMHV